MTPRCRHVGHASRRKLVSGAAREPARVRIASIVVRLVARRGHGVHWSTNIAIIGIERARSATVPRQAAHHCICA